MRKLNHYSIYRNGVLLKPNWDGFDYLDVASASCVDFGSGSGSDSGFAVSGIGGTSIFFVEEHLLRWV